MAIGNYVKNIGKSVGLAGMDVIKDLNPVISNTVTENKDFISEHYGKVKEFIHSDDGLKNSEYYKASTNLIKNAMKELKSGEIYTKESKARVASDMASSFGMDMADFDLDLSDIDEDGDVSKSSSKNSQEDFFDSSTEKEISEDGSKVDIANNTTKTLNRNTVNNVMMSSNNGGNNKATNRILSSSSKAMLDSSRVSTSALLKGINTLSTFQNETTVQFYNDVSNKLTDIGSVLTDISKMFGAGNQDQDVPSYDDDVDDLMANGLSLDFYKRRMQKNSENSNSEMGEMVSLFKEFALPALQGAAANPLGSLLKGGMKAMIPKNVKNSFKNMNDSLESLPLALQFLFKKWEGSDNKIKKGLAGMFGFDFAKKPKIDFGKYKKGAVSFDGITRRAIVNVIPSLLSKILAAVSNDPTHKEELVYDYEKGKFTTKDTIRQTMKQQIQQNSIDTPMEDFKAEVMSKFSAKEMTEELQKDINDAFKKIMQQALVPDSSLEAGSLSKNSKVENSIREMYANQDSNGNRKFQKGISEGLINRNSIYKGLMNNESFHNAYDIDTTSIKDIKEQMEKEKGLTSQERLAKSGLISKNGVLSRIFDMDTEETNPDKGGVFSIFSKTMDKLTNAINDFAYGDNEKGKITQKGVDIEHDEDDLLESSITKDNNYKNVKGTLSSNINTNIVNVYASKINDRFNSVSNDEKIPRDVLIENSNKNKKNIIAYKGTNFTRHKKEDIEKEGIVKEETKKSNLKNIVAYKGANAVRHKKESVITDTTDDMDKLIIEKEKDGKSTMIISGESVMSYMSKNIIDPIKNFFNDKIVNFFNDKILDPLKKKFNQATDWLTKKVFDPFKKKFKEGTDWLKEKVFDPLKKKGVDYFKDVIMKPISDAFAPLKNKFKEWFGKKKQGVMDWFGKKKDGIKSWFSKEILGGKTFTEAFNGWKGTADERIRSGVGFVTGQMGNLNTRLDERAVIAEELNNATTETNPETAKSKAEEIMKTAKAKAEEIMESAKIKAGEVTESAKGLLDNAKNLASGMLQSNLTESNNESTNEVTEEKRTSKIIKKYKLATANDSTKEDSKAQGQSALGNRIVTIDENVVEIKDTLIDFYNAYLSANGAEDGMPSKRKGGKGRFARIKSFFKDKFNRMKEMIKNPFKGIMDKLKGKFAWVKNIMKIPGKIGNAIKGIGDKIKGLVKGVGGIVKGIGGVVKKVLPSILKTAKSVLTTLYKDSKKLLGNIANGLGSLMKGAAGVVKSLYGDLKSVGKELWTTGKSAVGAVWNRFGKGKKEGRNKKMEVFVTGGHLDGIRETIFVSNKKNKNSYNDMKKKASMEDAENDAERDGNEKVGDEGREGNVSRIAAYRERISKLFGGVANGIKDWLKDSFLGKKLKQGKEWAASKYQAGKQKLGTKLLANNKKGLLGSISRSVGKVLSGPQTVSAVESQGMTAVWIMGNNNEGSGGATDVASQLTDALSGGKGSKAGGFFSKLSTRFMDSKLGTKFFNTKIGNKALDLATNGRGFLGNTKDITKSLGGKLGGKTKLLGGKLGGKAKLLGGKVGGKLASKIPGVGGKIASIGGTLASKAGLGAKVAGLGATGLATAGLGAKTAGVAGKAVGGLGKLGKVGGVLGKAGRVGGVLGKAGRLAGKAALPLTIAMGALDGFKGWKNAGETFGTEKATLGQKASSAGGSILSGLTLGLLNKQKASKTIHKVGSLASNLIPGVGAYKIGKKIFGKRYSKEDEEKMKGMSSKERKEYIANHPEMKAKGSLASNLIPGVAAYKMGKKLFGKRYSKEDEEKMKGMSSKERKEYLANNPEIKPIKKKSIASKMFSATVPGMLYNGTKKLFGKRYSKEDEEKMKGMSSKERKEYIANNPEMKSKKSIASKMFSATVPGMLYNGTKKLFGKRYSKEDEEKMKGMTPEERKEYIAKHPEMKTKRSIASKMFSATVPGMLYNGTKKLFGKKELSKEDEEKMKGMTPEERKEYLAKHPEMKSKKSIASKAFGLTVPGMLYNSTKKLFGKKKYSAEEEEKMKNMSPEERKEYLAKKGGNLLPVVGSVLFKGRNLIDIFRHGKKKEVEAEKKLLSQMTSEEKAKYLASKTNSEGLSGKEKDSKNPLSNLFGKDSIFGKMFSGKDGIFSGFKDFSKKALGLLGISAGGGIEKVTSAGGIKGFFQKMKNSISGKGYKTDAEVEELSGSGNGSGSGSGVSSGVGTATGNLSSVSDILNKNLTIKTNLSSEQINAMIEKYTADKPNSLMKGMGDTFLKASEVSGLDPAYLVAHAATESAWGTSQITRDKNNWYGIGAFDSSPYASAYGYNTVESGIIGGAKWIADNYASKGQNTLETMLHSPNGDHNYATSQSWADTIAKIMLMVSPGGVNGGTDGSGDTGGASAKIQSILSSARSQLGVPYQWSGTVPNVGLDCSGLVQYAYKANGINIGRTTYDQINDGTEVSKNDLKLGDLVFPHAGHVGIYSGNGNYIHAPKTGDVVKETPITQFWRARRISAGGPLIDANGFKSPTTGIMTSLYGNRKDPFTGEDAFHSGIDIANSEGTPIYAFDKGTVEYTGKNDEYGKMIKLNHGNGLSTVYGHNSAINVKEGQEVDRNTVISKMGSTGRATGSHLHFETQRNNKFMNPSSYTNNIIKKEKTSNNSMSAITSSPPNNDVNKMKKYTEMINIMNNIADNTGITNELLGKMFDMIDIKFKKDEEKKSVVKNNKNPVNPFLSGIDPDIEMIAMGV